MTTVKSACRILYEFAHWFISSSKSCWIWILFGDWRFRPGSNPFHGAWHANVFWLEPVSSHGVGS